MMVTARFWESFSFNEGQFTFVFLQEVQRPDVEYMVAYWYILCHFLRLLKMNLKPQTLLFSFFFFAVNRFWETFVKLKMNSKSILLL